MESAFLISSLIRVLLACIHLVAILNSLRQDTVWQKHPFLALRCSQCKHNETVQVFSCTVQTVKRCFSKVQGSKYWFQAPKCKQFCIIFCVIEPVAGGMGVTEPFRMEGTSGGPQSSIQLKAVSTLNSSQVAQGFIWLSLKTSRDTDTALSLGNLLILLRYIHSKLLFLNNILWDLPHGNLYLLSVVLMLHTFLITSPSIPVVLETVFSDSWICQLFLPGRDTSP